MLAVDRAQRGEFVHIFGIVELFADSVCGIARSLIKLKGAFQPELTVSRIALALLIRLCDHFLGFLDAPLFAIDESQLIGNAGIMWVAASRIQKPLFSSCYVSPLKARKP